MWQKVGALQKAFLGLVFSKPIAASFDVTNRCNLHCPMCYWWAHRELSELSDKKMLELAKKARADGIIQVTWVGGEPLIRKDLVAKLVEVFPYNWIVTNGTMGIPNLKNTMFIVSIDGTEKVHDKIRIKGLYQRVKQNISSRRDVITNTTLFRFNQFEPEKLLEEWKSTNIRGMTFNLSTPMRTTDKNFYMNDIEKNDLIDRLIKLKEKYGDFMLVSKKWLENLRPENVKKWYKKCLTRRLSVSYSSTGKRKYPCVLGTQAICQQCGCHVPALLKSLYSLDFETIKILYRMISF